MPETWTLVRCGFLGDARQNGTRDGAVLLEGARIVRAGPCREIAAPPGATVVDGPELAVLPALVNAHCHLDLSHLGSRPGPRADFVQWLDGVRHRRASGEAMIARSVRRGIELCRAGATGAVGDIAGERSMVPLREVRAARLRGVSFVEVIELARPPEAGVAGLSEITGAAEARSVPGQARLGISPHAPYTCHLEVYQAAAELDLPLATHLAESPDEIEFIRDGGGPIARFFERVGVPPWATGGRGRHPLDLLEGVLRRRPWLAAHVNLADAEHLRLLAETRTSVVYCPRATAYFGNDRGRGHRYREMLARGINVALGTDGLPCLDTPDRISVLDEMRLLYRRDRTDPALLLRMATTAGATALDLDPGLFALGPGPIAGLIGVPFDPGMPRDPLEQVLLRDDPPVWVAGPF